MQDCRDTEDLEQPVKKNNRIRWWETGAFLALFLAFEDTGVDDDDCDGSDNHTSELYDEWDVPSDDTVIDDLWF